MSSQFDRIVGLIGEENFSKIQGKKITVIGLGGVGGTAFEALVRSGFKRFNIIDFDRVDISNLNRQILYTLDDIGSFKVDAAKKRALSINKDIDVEAFNNKISLDILNEIDSDFVIDAIDDVSSKVLIAKYCCEHGIPFIASLGMANRMDASSVQITKINRTTNDPLAKKLRYEYKNSGVDLIKVNCVFSSESPKKFSNKLFSNISVTSSAGLLINNYVLDYFLNN